MGRDQAAKPLRERLQELKAWAGRSLVQGLFDQFDPIKALSGRAYALARLSKGASGPSRRCCITAS